MKPMTFGEKQKLLEIPCSWYLDDLPPQMFMKSQDNASGWTSPDVIFKLWKDEFDYLYEYEDEGVFPITIQPDVSGRPQGIMMHTELIEYMRSKRYQIRYAENQLYHMLRNERHHGSGF